MSNINDFLESYFKFHTEKGGTVDEFEKVAKKSLVETGQVSKDELSSFMSTKKIDQEIAAKRLAISVCESKIKELQSEIKILERKKPTTIRGTTVVEPRTPTIERDACGHPIHVDPCGRGMSSSSRSSC